MKIHKCLFQKNRNWILTCVLKTEVPIVIYIYIYIYIYIGPTNKIAKAKQLQSANIYILCVLSPLPSYNILRVKLQLLIACQQNW